MSPSSNTGPFEAYRGDAPYVFVSYAHQDSTDVYPELARLKKLGFNVWYDEGISPGSHWSDELAERINNCALFLFMVTPRSVTSRNCLDEANYVLNSDTPFLAIHLEETTLPSGLDLRMGSRQAILRHELEALSYESKLYAAVARHAATAMQSAEDPSRGVRLGPIVVEPLRGAITDARGESQHIEPKVMDVFVCLARRQNELITREELLNAVWTGQVAADELLTRAVSELRRVLGDASLIETVPKRGYRLVGDVQPLDSEKITAAAQIPREVSAGFSRRWVYVALGVVAVIIAFHAIDRYLADATWEPTSTTGGREHAIAVLPFENLSGDPEQEYFVDGIHGEVIATLGPLAGLTVISRASVMHYKGQRKPLPVIADELNVDLVVDGTVKRAGARISVTVALSDAQNGQQLWADNYEHELSDILDFQRNLAQEVVDKLRIELTPEDRTNLSTMTRVEPDAIDPYLLGTHILNKGLGPQIGTAIDHLEQSIEADPAFAQAHAALGRAYVWDLGFVRERQERQDLVAKARAVTDKAIELDSTLAESHVARARFEEYMMNWDDARSAFLRAIDLNPNSEIALSTYGEFLGSLGYLDESLRYMLKAQQIAPLSPGINQWLGWTYLNRAEHEKAIAQFERVLQLDPAHSGARSNLNWTYADAGMIERLVTGEDAESDCGDLEKLAWAKWRRGQQAAAKANFEASIELCPLGEDPGALAAGLVNVLLGDEERALDYLRRSYERREHEWVLETRWPWWDPLRDHPEFKKMMIESGLDEAAIPFSEFYELRNSQM